MARSHASIAPSAVLGAGLVAAVRRRGRQLEPRHTEFGKALQICAEVLTFNLHQL